MTRLTWVKNEFICKELCAPFVVNNDEDYRSDLISKYELVIKQAEKAGADDTSIEILKRYKKKVLKALDCYYSANIAKCNKIIKKLIKELSDDPYAVSSLDESYSFPGMRENEIQFFRCRVGDPTMHFTAKDMLHLPVKLRAKSGNYRFSIPGNPSLYLANSSYGCWIECGLPTESQFNVSPVVLDGKQKILNLVVSIRNFTNLLEFEEDRVHCWLKLYMLMLATSYRIREEGRTFKSEYIISQSIMMACKSLGYDGVANYSKRVTDEAFAMCAINLALFVEYDGDYSEIIKHMKIDDSYNYGMYKQLGLSLKYKDYEMRSVRTGFVTNIGNYDRQYPYSETDFFEFDKFMFYSWRDKLHGKGKEEIHWGVPIN